MFSTDYNRKIAEQVNQINKDFIKHSKRVNRIGGGLLNVAETDKSALGRPIGGKKMQGEGLFGDIWDGVKSVFGGSIPNELLEDEVPEIIEGGKKKCCKECVKGGKKKVIKKGGNFLDDVLDDVGKVAMLALGKPKSKKGVKKEVIEGGKKKKSSSWIEHVKAYAKKHKIKYPDALKDANCKASYKK